MASRSAAEPSPMVRLALGSAKEATGCKYRTLDPVWEEGFSFPVSNPLTQSLTLEVRTRCWRMALSAALEGRGTGEVGGWWDGEMGRAKGWG